MLQILLYDMNERKILYLSENFVKIEVIFPSMYFI